MQQIDRLRENEFIKCFVERFFNNDDCRIVYASLNFENNYRSIRKIVQRVNVKSKNNFYFLIDFFRLFVDL